MAKGADGVFAIAVPVKLATVSAIAIDLYIQRLLFR